MNHLERFLAKHLDDVMAWYANRPVTGVKVSCPEVVGASEDGFRTHIVEIQVELAVLGQPGWAENLRRLWREMTFLLRPIYGEVRSEGGYTRSGGAVFVEASAIVEKYPSTTRSWFWRGIPRKLGHAIVVGKEYQRLWPVLRTKATMEKGFAFASIANWADKGDVSKVTGQPPKAIALLPGEGAGPAQKYPRVWPFGTPFQDT